ncbi:MAG: type IV pilin [Methanoregula sp.]|jgi:FlaG/FlaF family flagellin (archaellin)
MHYQRKLSLKNGDAGVSPVVGVMLMLVVTIIIAAVVSGFSGGLVGSTNQNAPTLTMDVKISNSGSYSGSGFTATITSVSDPIPTKNIKLVTSWKTTSRSSGDSLSGGSSSMPLEINVDSYEVSSTGTLTSVTGSAPYGTGPGVTGNQDAVNPGTAQQFGNFTLTQGTGLVALAYPSVLTGSASVSEGYGVTTKYVYSSFDGKTDAATAVLGSNWQNLKAGDTVNVKLIHIPTGKVIYEKDVAVTEG